MEEGSGHFSTTDLPKPIASLGIVSLIAKFSERRKGYFKGLDGNSLNFFSGAELPLHPISWGSRLCLCKLLPDQGASGPSGPTSVLLGIVTTVETEWLGWLLTPMSACVGFPVGLVVKNVPANAGDPDSISGPGTFPRGGNDYSLQCSCLGNPMDRGAWWATVHGVTKESDTT